ncbi:MAG: glycosyltransferase family 4 protein [Acidobacteria bacterium]|nr:glycosyltransferase family 4 protein [Acidobacteriota bacterium]
MIQRLPGDWVIVAGGFHDHGAMDRANAALATHLLGHGARVHLVGHDIDDKLRREANAECHHVARPRSAAAIAESLLSRRGLAIASEVTSRSPHARVVVNGGNCPWPDINWVHAVHAAWPVHDDGAPAWVKVKHRALKALARRQERSALRLAGAVIANSHATRKTIVEAGLADPARVQSVYLGSDSSWQCAGRAERAAARAAFDVAEGHRVVAYVGTLGFDLNKGFDVLWGAWPRLAARSDWNATLLVAGGGGRLSFWQREAERAGLAHCVRFLGTTCRVRELLAAADLLVSPVKYEAYGLNVQEALCRGAGVMVTSTAGIVERFDAELTGSLLPPGVTADVLAERLGEWSTDVEGWRARGASTAAKLQARSWDDMAAEIVALAIQPWMAPESGSGSARG